MHFNRQIHIVKAHAEGEIGNVIVGGILPPPGETMFSKFQHCQQHLDNLRKLLLNEPRGRSAMCINLLVPPCDPRADAAFLIMEADEWATMSGSNLMCVATVLLETGLVGMREPETRLVLETAAGVVDVRAICDGGKCRRVEFDSVPALVYGLDYKVDVPELGEISFDVAFSWIFCTLVDAAAVEIDLEDPDVDGAEIVRLGNRISKEVRRMITPIHPQNEEIKGVTNLVFRGTVKETDHGKTVRNATVVLPGRLDRSPCGTGTCAQMAVLHAKGQLAVGEKLVSRSLLGSEFQASVMRTTTIGDFAAIEPTVSGRAWITGFEQVVLDPSDPYPQGFRLGDAWSKTE